jgi:hypothetical protein
MGSGIGHLPAPSFDDGAHVRLARDAAGTDLVPTAQEQAKEERRLRGEAERALAEARAEIERLEGR